MQHLERTELSATLATVACIIYPCTGTAKTNTTGEFEADAKKLQRSTANEHDVGSQLGLLCHGFVLDLYTFLTLCIYMCIYIYTHYR
jgi:hypothetical protein